MTRHRLNEPECLDFFHFILAMKYKDRSMPTQSHVEQGGMLMDLQAFMQGKVAMICGGISHFSTLRETIKDFRWYIVSMPRGIRQSCEAGTGGYAVWKHTPHPQQAVELLQFLVSPDGQLSLAGRAFRHTAKLRDGSRDNADAKSFQPATRSICSTSSGSRRKLKMSRSSHM